MSELTFSVNSKSSDRDLVFLEPRRGKCRRPGLSNGSIGRRTES